MANQINIATEFTRTPGVRYRSNGDFSGEQFREDVLKPMWLKSEGTIIINLDGTEGYPTSFLEEAFGGLAREFGADLVLQRLQFESVEEPNLLGEIRGYIEDTRFQ